jgi:hypothetical protein
MARGQVREADIRGNLTSDTLPSWACQRTQDGGMISVVAARSRNSGLLIVGVHPARPERLQRTCVWRSSRYSAGTLAVAPGVGPPAIVCRRGVYAFDRRPDSTKWPPKRPHQRPKRMAKRAAADNQIQNNQRHGRRKPCSNVERK